jgi:hypothetical protein
MVRRFLLLGAAMLLLLLGVPACSDNNKGKAAPTVTDPDGNYVPKPAGGKPG